MNHKFAVAIRITVVGSLLMTVVAGAAGEEPIILTPKPGPEPRINGPRLFGVRPGRPFLYRIPCTGERPIAFAVGGLPEGLSVDAGSGIITGNAPSEIGQYVVKLTAQQRARCRQQRVHHRRRRQARVDAAHGLEQLVHLVSHDHRPKDAAGG